MAKVYYRRGPNDKCPFQNSPSGSEWDASHLRWLEIDFIENCDLSEIFPAQCLLNQNGSIVKDLRQHLGKPWKDIMAIRRHKGSERVYDLLKYLHNPTIEDSTYIQSSSPRGTLSPRTPTDIPSSPPLGSHWTGAQTAYETAQPVPTPQSKSGEATTLRHGAQPTDESTGLDFAYLHNPNVAKPRYAVQPPNSTAPASVHSTPEGSLAGSDSETTSQVNPAGISPLRHKQPRPPTVEVEEPRLPGYTTATRRGAPSIAEASSASSPLHETNLACRGTTGELLELAASSSPGSSNKCTSSSPLKGDINIQGSQNPKDKPEADVKQAADAFADIVATAIVDAVDASDLEYEIEALVT